MGDKYKILGVLDGIVICHDDDGCIYVYDGIYTRRLIINNTPAHLARFNILKYKGDKAILEFKPGFHDRTF